MKFLTMLTILAFSVFSYANSSLPNNRHISVIGNAQLTAKPDIAVIHLNVTSVKATSAEAKTDVDSRVNRLLAGLARFEIDKKNVSASNITTRPQYSYVKNNKREIDGYTANRAIKVTLNDLKKLNAFMDFALSVKINEIGNIALKSSIEKDLKEEAYALAVANAKEKGGSMANAFGATLGKIYSINAASNNIQHRFGANRAIEQREVTSARMAQPANPGQYLQENIVFSASISAVFDLEVK